MTPVCGDGLRATTEACDDGNISPNDSCSATCTVTPELITPVRSADAHDVPLSARTLGVGRHPFAAGCNTVGVAFADHTSEPPALYLSTYDTVGVPLSVGGKTSLHFADAAISTPDPGVAALPDDSFAVAWTDFGVDGDELGISLQRVIPGASAQPPATVANESSAFTQSNSDIVFDGNELVVAWTDSSDDVNGPDLRYRLFSTDLKPLTGDLTLANTAASEDDVVLAAQSGQWAAAWRSASQGNETIEVQSGAAHWTIGPFLPGKTGDRPDLTFLDAGHLAVGFTKGTDPNNTGTADTPRLYAAVLDFAAPGPALCFEVPPAQDPYSFTPSIGQSEPSVVVTPDHLLVGWKSGGISGDPNGSELWTRRIPFTVNTDHSVTLDPSHIEVPAVQTTAQRAGDQSAFRLLHTNAWPTGGVAAAWNDASHSFGALAGVPDVALQFLPDFIDLPQVVTPYPLSADGKYYFVNLLRRQYAAPFALSPTYLGTATQYPNATQYGPQYAFDGSTFGWNWRTPTASDPNGSARAVFDLGQIYQVGAIRQVYYAHYETPQQYQIRLATVPGQWTTVVPQKAVDQTLYDFTEDGFSSTPARYLELTMVGGSTAQGIVALMELYVYPSSTAAAPTTSDGYDYTYLSKASFMATNFGNTAWYTPWPLRTLTPVTTATSDAVATFDLGGQYQANEIDLDLSVAGTWTGGGKLEVAAIPDTWSTVSDSGAGNPFGSGVLNRFFLPGSEPVRYLRLTDYYVPGSGPSPTGLSSIQVFGPRTTPYVTKYPLGDAQTYYRVNLLRKKGFTPNVTVAYANGAQQSTLAGNAPGNVVDGDDQYFEWKTTTAVANASATLTVDLGSIQSLGAVRQQYQAAGRSPNSYSLRLSSDGTTWTTLATNVAAAAADVVNTFSATSARYVELTMTGTRSGSVLMDLGELMVYPSTAVSPPPDMTFGSDAQNPGRYDLTYLPGVVMTGNSNMNPSNVLSPISRFPTVYTGKTAAGGATGDGTIDIDLGQPYAISQINLAFNGTTNWVNGGMVQVATSPDTWTTLYDSGRNPTSGFGSPTIGGGLKTLTFPQRSVRFIRVTDYFVSGVGTSSGALGNVEVFQ